MVSGGYLVGYVAQGAGAPFLGWVVTSHGLMAGLVTGAVVFSVFFVLVLACGLAARRTAPDTLRTSLRPVRARA
jgi:hypothetical protein